VRVTETDAAGGAAETTQALIEAEQVAAAWPGAATVLRLAGIYGPGRTHLVEQVRSAEVAGRPEMHLNLIHRDDIVAGLWAAFGEAVRRPMKGAASGAKIFNLADEGEATKGDVVAWLAERLGVAMPRFTGQPAGGRRAVTPDRIVDAARAKAELGWRAAKRTFREGYADVLASGG
jgi:nucleoside-diphosphate-sugar epimerase